MGISSDTHFPCKLRSNDHLRYHERIYSTLNEFSSITLIFECLGFGLGSICTPETACFGINDL